MSQLGQLTASQTIAIVLLVVVMCGAIWVMTDFAAQREMVPLLNQQMSQTSRSQIIRKLETWDEQFELKGEIILVHKSKQRKLLAMLLYEGLLPEDTSVGFLSLLEDTDGG